MFNACLLQSRSGRHGRDGRDMRDRESCGLCACFQPGLGTFLLGFQVCFSALLCSKLGEVNVATSA